MEKIGIFDLILFCTIGFEQPILALNAGKSAQEGQKNEAVIRQCEKRLRQPPRPHLFSDRIGRAPDRGTAQHDVGSRDLNSQPSSHAPEKGPLSRDVRRSQATGGAMPR